MSQLYHPHQSKGLTQPKVTITHQRCPVTGHLMKPGEGDTVVVEHLGRKNKPIGKRTSIHMAAKVTPYDYHCWRERFGNVQVVHD